MAKRSRKRKQSHARAKHREKLAAHARRVKEGLLQGAKIQLEPKGQEKMSKVLEAFAEPYLELADTEHGREMLFHLAVVAWNAALLPEENRQAMIDEVLKEGAKQIPKKGQRDLKLLLAAMIQRKLSYFAENRRFIVSIELTEMGQDYYLSVASTPDL
jgi:hypothetical protein